MSPRTRASERGAVAVEAALVTPILLILIFGIIEIALLMRDHVALTSATRVGGRTASANPGAGPGGVNEGGDCVAPCSPTNAPMFAQLAANAIQRAGTALPKDSIQELWIYKANNKGYPGAANSTSMACGTSCVKYKWNPAKDQFRYFSGSWPSATVNACANNSPDAVGIHMVVKHSFVTGFLGDHLMLEDHAVFAFEPMPTLTCSAGAHP